MISTSDFKTGVTIEIDGDPFQIVDFQHVKPGKGAAFVKTKLRNLRSGSVTEKTFRAGEKLEKAPVERKEMQYLYNDGDSYVFMDNESYEQINVQEEKLGGAQKYLIENMNCTVAFYQGEIIALDVPNAVTLEVVETEPGIKGDTATGGTKSAKLETGITIQVPFFVNQGEKIKVDTRTGHYVERA